MDPSRDQEFKGKQWGGVTRSRSAMERRSFWRMKTDLPNPVMQPCAKCTIPSSYHSPSPPPSSSDTLSCLCSSSAIAIFSLPRFQAVSTFAQLHLDMISESFGKFEDISQESNKIFHLDTYEGIMINFQRGLSNSFMIDHAMHLQPSAEQYGTYHFGANFAEGKHLLLSKTATNGEVFARYIGTLTPNFSLNMQAQLVPTPHNSHALITADYKGSDWFAQCKVSHAHCLWRGCVTRLKGGEDYASLLPFLMIDMQACLCLQAHVNWTAPSFVCAKGKKYIHTIPCSLVPPTPPSLSRVRDNLTFGTEMSVDVASTESLVSDRTSAMYPDSSDFQCAVGYEYSTQAGAFKTNLTTDGKVTSIFEKTLSEVSSMSLSVEVKIGMKHASSLIAIFTG
eukprot:765172-Hanusia_phi.AAC.1